MNKLKAALATLVLGLTGLMALPAAPAQAAPSGCADGFICFYDYAGGGGFLSNYPGSLPRNTCYAGESMASAFFNRTGTRWYGFRDPSCSGAHIEWAVGNWGPLPAGWDNNIQAVMRTSITY